MFNFDNSLLSDFAKCEAKAIAKHVLFRIGKGNKEAAEIGNSGHAFMEEYFKGEGEGKAFAAFEREYDKVIPVGEVPSKPALVKGNLENILREYVRRRPVENFPIEPIEFEEIKGIELAEGLKFWIKRDMLVRDKNSGLLCPLDHKFRIDNKITDWWLKKFRNGSQFSGYLWVSRELAKEAGEMVDNKILVNAVEFSKLPDSERRCPKHKVKYSECGRLHAAFDVYTVSRTEEQLQGWRRDVELIARQAEFYFKAFNTVEALPYAFKRGTFNESCTFCGFFQWCRVGFKKELMEELTDYYRWAPWEEGEGEKDKPQVETLIQLKEAPQTEISIQEGQTYKWYWIQEGDKIVPAKGALQGGFELDGKTALKSLWQRGNEAWMKVWRDHPGVQEEMLKWKKENIEVFEKNAGEGRVDR